MVKELNIAKAALTNIASLNEGERVTGSFDEPHAAEAAREALAKMDAPEPVKDFAPLERYLGLPLGFISNLEPGVRLITQ
jgi:hypothetical protein